MMNWLALNRLCARVMLWAPTARLYVGALSFGSAIIGTILLEFTTLRPAIEDFIATLFLMESFHLTLPVEFGGCLLASALWLSSIVHRYRARLLQQALGRLYVDGVIGGKTLQRAISLQRFADDGTDQPCRIDVIECLFPATDEKIALPEAAENENPLADWLYHAGHQPEKEEEISPFATQSQPNK